MALVTYTAREMRDRIDQFFQSAKSRCMFEMALPLLFVGDMPAKCEEECGLIVHLTEDVDIGVIVNRVEHLLKKLRELEGQNAQEKT